MIKNVLEQKEAFEDIYSLEKLDRFNFHITPDKFIRYLRDRRLQKALDYLKANFKDEIYQWKVLTVCGGVGGEGMFFLRAGFKDVTVSDFSANSLIIAKQFDKDLKTMQLDAEALDLPDNAYDLVVVQDGLHHLPRPSLGFTEMLRVASKAIIVVEPYNSVVGKMIGTEWEEHEDAINYVYRWDRKMVEQTVKSFLLKRHGAIRVFRFWDHNVVVGKLAKLFPAKLKLQAAKMIYAALIPFSFTGNMMVGVVVKNP
ncbi:MAG TPA: class I SAM-dependent methyltransferase [Puia sp.]|jgi:ubiquinone/menaquinone biosynthesis C-methylase UbiE|nr:class I SAM-dependent methyltransferase [Puia sp.]